VYCTLHHEPSAKSALTGNFCEEPADQRRWIQSSSQIQFYVKTDSDRILAKNPPLLRFEPERMRKSLTVNGTAPISLGSLSLSRPFLSVNTRSRYNYRAPRCHQNCRSRASAVTGATELAWIEIGRRVYKWASNDRVK
jgi:hypothetical protein